MPPFLEMRKEWLEKERAVVSHQGWGGPVRNQRPRPQSLEASRPLRNSGPRGSERWRRASQLPSQPATSQAPW